MPFVHLVLFGHQAGNVHRRHVQSHTLVRLVARSVARRHGHVGRVVASANTATHATIATASAAAATCDVAERFATRTRQVGAMYGLLGVDVAVLAEEAAEFAEKVRVRGGLFVLGYGRMLRPRRGRRQQLIAVVH